MEPIVCRMADRDYTFNEPQPNEAGTLFFFRYHPPATQAGERACYSWDNCDGRHLKLVLPVTDHSGDWHIPIDLTGRTSNCSMPNERTHRCRVIEGTPPKVTLRAGCAVGPSIGYPGAGGSYAFHGFLVDGVLREV